MALSTTDHQHIVSYFVLPAVGGTPEAIVDTLDAARAVLRTLPAYLHARIEVRCWHCGYVTEAR
jgi:hypothetical protein